MPWRTRSLNGVMVYDVAGRAKCAVALRRGELRMEFYSVKHREKVEVSESEISKRVVERETKSGGTQKRYMLIAKTQHKGDQVTMTKFVNEATFNSVPD